jgi:hypothetical protein
MKYQVSYARCRLAMVTDITLAGHALSIAQLIAERLEYAMAHEQAEDQIPIPPMQNIQTQESARTGGWVTRESRPRLRCVRRAGSN